MHKLQISDVIKPDPNHNLTLTLAKLHSWFCKLCRLTNYAPYTIMGNHL